MADNVIRIDNFIDVTTGVQPSSGFGLREFGAVLFIARGDDTAPTGVRQYSNMADVQTGEGSNSEAARAAIRFYGGGWSGFSPSTAFFVGTIDATSISTVEEGVSGLMDSEAYYLVLADADFTVAERKAIASIVEATKAPVPHFLLIQDNSADAANLDLNSDTTSVAAYCKGLNLTKVMAIWSNPSNTERYYTAAAASYFAVAQFNASGRRLGTLAFKQTPGVMAVDVTDPAITTLPQVTWQNLSSKNASAYINVKTGITWWQQGNLANGDDASAYIVADYITYMLVRGLYGLLTRVPMLPMNQDGASQIATVVSVVFGPVAATGLIGAGTSLDGESFGSAGYNLSLPIPQGDNKTQGLWSDIYITVLLTGITKKIVIVNTLKK